MLPTKLRSERCANDLKHFQLKVPSGTFSIAEIGLTFYCHPQHKCAFFTSIHDNKKSIKSQYRYDIELNVNDVNFVFTLTFH